MTIKKTRNMNFNDKNTPKSNQAINRTIFMIKKKVNINKILEFPSINRHLFPKILKNMKI